MKNYFCSLHEAMFGYNILGYKRSFFIIFLLGFGSLFSQAREVTGRIDSVTVYPSRAVVHRVHTVKPRESGVVRFVKLPHSILSGSILVSGKNVQVLGVQKGIRLPDAPDKKTQLEIERDKLVDTRNAIRDEHKNIQSQLKLLDSFGQLSIEKSNQQLRNDSVSLKKWDSILKFMSSKRNAYFVRLRLKNREMEEINKQIRVLNDKINREKNQSRYSREEVQVSYKSASTKRGKIVLEYQVYNVSWKGVYDVFANTDANNIQLNSHAVIRQTSGEDWKNVRLTLSTTQPTQGMDPGELQPWRVSPGTFGGYMKKSARLDDAKMAKSVVREKKEVDMEEVSGGGNIELVDAATQTFVLSGRESVLGDNSEIKVTLQKETLKAKLTHVTIPARTNTVFLKALVKNVTGKAIPAGALSVYMDGNFSGNSAFRTLISNGEEFDLFLGQDQRLQVKRKLIRGDILSSGIFSTKVKVLNEWEIELTNFSRKTREVKLQDQFPIASDPRIVTKFTGSNKKVEADKNGILTWKLNAFPSKKEVITFSYEIEVDRETWEEMMDNLPVMYKNKSNRSSTENKLPQQYNLEQILQRKR